MSARRRSIRVLTWNVHGCSGAIGRFDPDAIVDAIRDMNPDIAAVQEIDARYDRARGLDTFEYLRESLGWNAIEARTIRTEHGDYGHAVLSPWQVRSARTFDLSVDGHEPRAAVACTIGELGVDVYATHLGLRARERRAQMIRLVDQIGHDSRASTIVLGDFNEWRRRGGVAARLLSKPFVSAAALPSFPAWRPFFALDRIWCGRALEPVDAWSVRRLAALSDHLPIIAELRHRPS